MKLNEAIKRLPKNVELKYLEILGKTVQTYIWIFDLNEGYPEHKRVAGKLNLFIPETNSLVDNIRAGHLKINANGALTQDRGSMDFLRANPTSDEFEKISYGDIQIFND